MRFLLLIIFLLPVTVYSQNVSVRFLYAPKAKKLSSKQQQQFLNLIEKRRVKSVELVGHVGSKSSVSKNRIAVEYRLENLQKACFTAGIPSNQIILKRLYAKNDSLYNKVLVRVQYLSDLKKGIIRKTNLVQVSIYDPARKPKIVKTPKKVKAKVKEKKVAQDKKKTDIDSNDYGKFKIKDFRKGQKIVIPELYFTATRHDLRPVSYRSLRYLLKIMRDKPTLKIDLQGHICCKKNGEDGLDFGTNKGNLSEARAKAIYDYLVRYGISPARLSYRGFGSKYKLVEDNGNAMKGLKNRRVEIEVIEE